MAEKARVESDLSPLGLGVVVGLVVLYGFCIPWAADKLGDFSHLWAAGRSVVVLGPGGLYAPAAHYLVLTEALGPLGPDLWASRNDVLGTFFYPPATGLFYTGLGLLPLRTAGLVHGALYVLAALAAAVALAGSRWRTLALPGTLALVLLYPSTFYGFALGQNGVYALLAVAGAGWCWSRDRPIWAGALLGLLMLKPSWGLAAVLVPVVLRSHRMLGALLSVAGGLAALGLVLGPQASARFFVLSSQLVQLDQLADYPLHLQHNLLGLVRRSGLPDVLGWGAVGGLTAVTAVRVQRLPRAEAWGLLWVTATLFNPHVHHYDLLVALVGLLALVSGSASPRRKVLVCLAVHGAFVAEEAFATASVISLPAVSLLLLWGALAFPPAD